MANFHKYGRVKDDPHWDGEDFIFYLAPFG
jgi:hypothetical protein